jgi:glycosyltransferase involved in cell wall biosynthesis
VTAEPHRGPFSARLAPSHDWVVADASWTWTERLFAPLSTHGQRVLLIQARDWRNAIDQRMPLATWINPLRRRSPRLWEHQFVLPPGWMKSYPWLGMRPISRAIHRWHRGLPNRKPLALAISYPHYLYLARMIRPDALVYYNMDDYALYWTSRGNRIRALEAQVIAQADLSLFCAATRARHARALVPRAAERIVHLPHGAPEQAITDEPLHRPADAPFDLAEFPRPYAGFIGSLCDRVDWRLLDRLAEALPRVSLILIGREPRPEPDAAWYQDFQQAARRPNVHLLGWRSQIERYSQAFDACLIPYLPDHPFNHASCPTKIMDYMATSRPVVSTPVPECTLHRGLFHVAEDHQAFIRAVERIVNQHGDDGLAQARWNAARCWTWDHAADRLLQEFDARVAEAPAPADWGSSPAPPPLLHHGRPRELHGHAAICR